MSPFSLKLYEFISSVNTKRRKKVQNDNNLECMNTCTHPQVMLSIVKQEPDFAVTVREKYFLQGDDIRML